MSKGGWARESGESASREQAWTQTELRTWKALQRVRADCHSQSRRQPPSPSARAAGAPASTPRPLHPLGPPRPGPRPRRPYPASTSPSPLDLPPCDQYSSFAVASSLFVVANAAAVSPVSSMFFQFKFKLRDGAPRGSLRFSEVRQFVLRLRPPVSCTRCPVTEAWPGVDVAKGRVANETVNSDPPISMASE
ncbi:hypothetical protein K438DRAFT_1749737 [Mycena galopus ATCC 62051]|nr:hypothetical protein K438DRAFT_1749737 [Mycena galopus ATCC 62051]